MPHLKTQDRQYLGGKTKEEEEAEPEPTCLGPVGDRAQHCCSRATLPGLAGGQPRPPGPPSSPHLVSPEPCLTDKV